MAERIKGYRADGTPIIDTSGISMQQFNKHHEPKIRNMMNSQKYLEERKPVSKKLKEYDSFITKLRKRIEELSFKNKELQKQNWKLSVENLNLQEKIKEFEAKQ